MSKEKLSSFTKDQFSRNFIKEKDIGYQCEVCCCSIPPSKEVVLAHITGVRHCSAMKRKEEEKKLRKTLYSSSKYTGIRESRSGYYCKLCNRTCTSSSNVESHIKGARHREALQDQKHSSRRHSSRHSRSSSRSSSSSRSRRDHRSSDIADSKRSSHLEQILKPKDIVVGLSFVIEYCTQPRLPKEKPKWYYSCTMCAFKCVEADIVKHLTGTEHRIAYIKNFKMEDYMKLANLEKGPSNNLSFLLEDWVLGHLEKYGRGIPKGNSMPSLLEPKPHPPPLVLSPEAVKSEEPSDKDERKPPSASGAGSHLGESPIVLDSDSEENLSPQRPAAMPPPQTNTDTQTSVLNFECKTQQDADFLRHVNVTILASIFEFKLKEASIPEDEVKEKVESYKLESQAFIKDYIKKFSLSSQNTSGP